MYHPDSIFMKHTKALIQNNVTAISTVKNGLPTISGTGILVEDIAKCFSDGMSIKEIMKKFSALTREDQVISAIMYVALSEQLTSESYERLLGISKTLVSVFAGKTGLGLVEHITLDSIKDVVQQIDPLFKI